MFSFKIDLNLVEQISFPEQSIQKLLIYLSRIQHSEKIYKIKKQQKQYDIQIKEDKKNVLYRPFTDEELKIENKKLKTYGMEPFLGFYYEKEEDIAIFQEGYRRWILKKTLPHISEIEYNNIPANIQQNFLIFERIIFEYIWGQQFKDLNDCFIIVFNFIYASNIDFFGDEINDRLVQDIFYWCCITIYFHFFKVHILDELFCLTSSVDIIDALIRHLLNIVDDETVTKVRKLINYIEIYLIDVFIDAWVIFHYKHEEGEVFDVKEISYSEYPIVPDIKIETYENLYVEKTGKSSRQIKYNFKYFLKAWSP